MNKLDDQMADEIRGLMDAEFTAGWVKDLKIGDIFAGPRLFSFDEPRVLFVLERLHHSEASYIAEDNELVNNVVVSMIVTDQFGLQRHLMYGHTSEIYIWQGVINL